MAFQSFQAPGNGEVMTHQASLGRGASGHALQSGNDPIESDRIAGEYTREGIEVPDHAAQRLGVFGQDPIEPTQRFASGLRHALAGRSISHEEGLLPLLTSEAGWTCRRPAAAMVPANPSILELDRCRGTTGSALASRAMVAGL